jgi:hypothetical protein
MLAIDLSRRRWLEVGVLSSLLNSSWKRWIAIGVALLAAYAAFGFWLVPLAIKNQLPKFGQSQLARQKPPFPWPKTCW